MGAGSRNKIKVKYQIFIKENDRLLFKNSDAVVKTFLKERLKGIGEVFFYKENFHEFVDRNKNIVITNIMNPVLDLEAIDEAFSYMQRAGEDSLKPVGLIPGTQFDFLVSKGTKCEIKDLVATAKEYHFDTQETYNNQFNLYKYKRLKIFLGLFEGDKSISKKTILDFIKHLEKKDIIEKLLSFYEDCRMDYHESCPYCGGEIRGLKNKFSQPFMGYLPNSKSFYYECRSCTLVFLSPCPKQEDIHKIYDEFDKQDFVVSHNNPYKEGKSRCDFGFVSKHFPKELKHLDLGGGIGNFSLFMRDHFKKAEVTHSDFEIKQNIYLEKKGVNTRAINFLKEEIGYDQYNLITMWEVIEHITFDKLESVLQKINVALEKDGLFIFSTPDYGSAMCQAYDFYSACPPYHPLCFSKKWLELYLKENQQWEIVGVKSCSDFLEDMSMWMQYAQETSPAASLKGISTVLQCIFDDENHEDIIKKLLEKGLGTEVIFALKKK